MSSRSAAVRTWRSLEALAGTTRGAVLVFAAALCVYGLESIAMPLAPGRNLGTYLQYYDQFFHGTALPMVMLFRTPGAPLVIGPALDFLGGWGSQVLMGFLFAVTVTSWSAVAALFGRRVAVLTAIALVLFPATGCSSTGSRATRSSRRRSRSGRFSSSARSGAPQRSGWRRSGSASPC